MLRLALAALLLAACGDSTPHDAFIDAGTLDAGCDNVDFCNAIEQTGCSADQRCTFAHDTIGTACGPACVADGTSAPGEACTLDATSQLDDCAAGAYCTDGVCRPFCETAPDMCELGTHCENLGSHAVVLGSCLPDA